MQNATNQYNPDDPKDVSDFLNVLFDLYLQGRTGVDQATVLATQLAAAKEGRRLLHNAHKVVSGQIGKCAEPKIFSAQQ
jgi:hypothetical protein